MFGDDERQTGRGERKRDLGDLVADAIGQSVTPSRLMDADNVGFLRRLLGQKPVEGPFSADLEEGEQPHYLFHSTSGLSLPEGDDEYGDDHFSFKGQSLISPAVGMITDRRSVFVYGRGDTRRVVPIRHSDLVDVDYRDRRVEKALRLRTTRRRLSFRLWATDPYAAELSDAAAYVFDRSDSEGDYRTYDFESEDHDAARDALKEQFAAMQGLGERIDFERAATYAGKGAQIGFYQSPHAAGVGFLLGAGYGIWSDLNGAAAGAADGAGDAGGDVGDLGDIDAVETAETMLRWQRAGQVSNAKSVELASGALGAALAIDRQTSGRRVSSALADLDVEGVSRRLDAGERREAGLQVASEVLDSYAGEISGLLDDDFFEQLERME